MSEELNVLTGTVDRYNGITIDTENEVIGDEFPNRLQSKTLLTPFIWQNQWHHYDLWTASLAHWRQNSMRTIWFKVKTSHAKIVPTLVEVNWFFILYTSIARDFFLENKNTSCLLVNRMDSIFIMPKKDLSWCSNGCRWIHRQTFQHLLTRWLGLAVWWWTIKSKYSPSKKRMQSYKGHGSYRAVMLSQVRLK